MKYSNAFHKIKLPFFLFLVCLVVYFPLSSFLFALKNDAFIFNFPNKHFFTEALRAGHLPTWNPYLNFGFPLYADPGFAWWHPLTWIFGLIGYTPMLLSIEVLTYIYIAGLGMYFLGRTLRFSRFTSFAMGCMFMGCGFFIGNLQHINFITCAAFLPWLTAFWLLYQQDTSMKNIVGCTISAYLLCTGGHPAIPIAATLFFIILSLLFSLYHRSYPSTGRFWIIQLKLLFFIVLPLLPFIFSILNLLPFYSRGATVDHSNSTLTGFTIQSYISFVYPFATIKNFDFFRTDVSMRNAYFSIIGILGFLMYLLRKQKSILQNIFLAVGILMLLISLGGKTKEFLYESLPGFSFIRTNGEFRVFTIFSFIICGSFELEKIFQKEKFPIKHLKKLLEILFVFSSIASIGLVLFSKVPPISIPEGSLLHGIKTIIDNFTFWQTFFIAGIISACLCLLYFISLRIPQLKRATIIIIVLDIVLNSWFLLPITGVGKTSPGQIQQIINKAPKGFTIPQINNEIETQKLSNDDLTLIGNWAWYDKEILHERIDYPSILKTTERFLKSSDTCLIRSKVFAFFKNQNANTLLHTSFNPSASTFQLNVQKKDTLIILQNYFPGWEAKRNNKPSPILKYLSTFIAIPIEKGDSILKIEFLPLRH